MNRLSGRNHSAIFKAKVALATIDCEQTAVRLAEHFDVHPNQITRWNAQLLERAAPQRRYTDFLDRYLPRRPAQC